jgi:hypothetical protein
MAGTTLTSMKLLFRDFGGHSTGSFADSEGWSRGYALVHSGTVIDVRVVVPVVTRVKVCSTSWSLHHVELAEHCLSDLEERLHALLRLVSLHVAA